MVLHISKLESLSVSCNQIPFLVLALDKEKNYWQKHAKRMITSEIKLLSIRKKTKSNTMAGFIY